MRKHEATCVNKRTHRIVCIRSIGWFVSMHRYRVTVVRFDRPFSRLSIVISILTHTHNSFISKMCVFFICTLSFFSLSRRFWIFSRFYCSFQWLKMMLLHKHNGESEQQMNKKEKSNHYQTSASIWTIQIQMWNTPNKKDQIGCKRRFIFAIQKKDRQNISIQPKCIAQQSARALHNAHGAQKNETNPQNETMYRNNRMSFIIIIKIVLTHMNPVSELHKIPNIADLNMHAHSFI